MEKILLYEKVNHHINIVKMYNAWIEDDALYIQMELCRKSLLHFILENKEMEEHHTWNVMIDILQVCIPYSVKKCEQFCQKYRPNDLLTGLTFRVQALQYIHSFSFVHLDVKPENILLGYDERYKLADFDLIYDLNVSEPTN